MPSWVGEIEDKGKAEELASLVQICAEAAVDVTADFLLDVSDAPFDYPTYATAPTTGEFDARAIHCRSAWFTAMVCVFAKLKEDCNIASCT